MTTIRLQFPSLCNHLNVFTSQLLKSPEQGGAATSTREKKYAIGYISTDKAIFAMKKSYTPDRDKHRVDHRNADSVLIY